MGCRNSVDWNCMRSKCIAVHDSSNTAQDPEVESVLSQWNNPDLIPNADNWTFDVFEFAKNSREGFLVKFAGYVLAQTGLFDQLNLDRQKLFYLFQDVEDSYHSHIPYHNAIHATDVLQAVYHAINKESGGIRLIDRLTSDEILSIILAAVGHDIGHFGRTNHFLRSTNHHLAQLSSDSPNEAMHYRVFYQKIIKWNVLDGFTKVRRDQIIANIKELILATNMDHHAQILAAWREKSKYFTFNSDDNRLALMKYVLKFADISNPARPKKLYDQWTRVLREELHQEGDEMQTLGMDVDATRNRSLPSTVAKIQCWFIENRVQLYLRNIKQIGINLDAPESQLKQNLNQWRQRNTC